MPLKTIPPLDRFQNGNWTVDVEPDGSLTLTFDEPYDDWERFTERIPPQVAASLAIQVLANHTRKEPA